MKFILLTLFFICFCSCTTMTKFSLEKKKGIKIHYSDGSKFYASKKKNSVVVLGFPSSEQADGERAFLFVYYENLSDKPHVAVPESIRVVQKSSRSNIGTTSYKEMIREVNKRKTAFAILSAIGGVVTALDAGRSSYSGTINTSSSANLNYSGIHSSGYGEYPNNYYGSASGSYSGSTSYSGTHYSSAQASREINDYADNVSRGLASFDNKKRALKNTILKRNSVMSNQSISGLVAVDFPELENDYDYYAIIVKFAGDRHSFVFKQSIVD